jgi:hypothetical protein
MKHQPVPKDDLRERFILFLATKPADQRYDWHSIERCACGTFINEHGLGFKSVRVRRWYAPWSFKTVGSYDRVPALEVWRRWNETARVCSTYGELLHKVRGA